MIQIRHGVFETNSSSTHSVTVFSKKFSPSTLDVYSDGYIHVNLGEFGWEVRNYYSQNERLSYLLTMLYELTGRNIPYSHNYEQNVMESMIESDDFTRIVEDVCSYTDADGIVIDNTYGYIDHQSSTDEYRTIDEFLDDCGCTITEFVFGDICVHTDNDNH